MTKKMGQKQQNRGLTQKQVRFVQEMMIDPNATNAAIKAGYSKTSAYSQGCTLLKNPKVSAELQRLRDERAGRKSITADDVLAELGLVAFSDVLNHFRFDPLTGEVTVTEGAPEGISRAVSSVEFTTHYDRDGEPIKTQAKFRVWPKVDALKLVATHLGMLVTRIAGGDGGPVKVQSIKFGDKEVVF